MNTSKLEYRDQQGRRYVGYLAVPGRPEGQAILLAHNAPGVSDFERTTARRLADAGYIVLCADYVGDGELLTAQGVQTRLGAAIADTSLLRDAMTAGLAALIAQPGVDAGKVAATGYCLGGAAALELSRTGAAVAAVAVFHSRLPVTRPEDNKRIRGKVLVQTGTADPIVPAALRQTFETQMDEAGVDWRMILHGGAHHAFTVPDIDALGVPALRYSREASDRSWRAMHDLLAETIGAPSA